MCPYKKEAEGVLTQSAEKKMNMKKRRQCEDRGRDWTDEATSQKTPAATSNQKRQETDSPLEPLEVVWLF